MTHPPLWHEMKTAPRDGSPFDVLCVSKAGIRVIVPRLFYGHKPMRKRPDGTIDDEQILWGKHNFLSPYLTPIGWRECRGSP